MNNLLAKLKPYMISETDRSYTKTDCLISYSNNYISVLRVDSSNKWVTNKECGYMSKMWSIIVNKKLDFSHLTKFMELQNILDIKITPVKKENLLEIMA